MKKIFLICLISPIILSQPLGNNFINALVNKNSYLSDFVDTDELTRSERLGIKYTDVNYKWLISFDIPDEIKAGFREEKYDYSLQTMQLEDGFSIVTLAVGSLNYLQKFYFLNGKFVPPSVYFTRNWEGNESKYFKFKISEPKYFNDYCVKRLDDFVDSLCNLLDFDKDRKKLLETEKIYYTFCRDEDEVEKITGYKSKGMSVLAFDEVITAYQTHFHEVSHILINFKLKNLNLYTLPFFLEGFAVAVGGRGGMAPRVVTDLGYYLQKTGFLTYDSILTYESFYSQDANMTYAVSGLYNRFLLDELGGAHYLELYRKLNGDLNFVKKISPIDIFLPSFEKFDRYLNNYENDSLSIIHPDKLMTMVSYFEYGKISEYFNYYCFSADITKNYIPLFNDTDSSGLKLVYSSKLSVNLTKSEYKGENYLLFSDSINIKLYNIFNDELIFSYDKNFKINPQKALIGFNKNNYIFCLKKSLFDSGIIIKYK